MRKGIGILIFLLVLVDSFSYADVFHQISGVKSNLYCLAIDPSQPDLIFAGSQNAIYKSINGGKEWQKVYIIKGNSTTVNMISVSEDNPSFIYIASDSGLYLSRDKGESFQKIFGKAGEKVFCIKERNKKLFIGTDNGLYYCQTSDFIFKKISHFPENANVFWIIFINSTTLIASNYGVYKTENFYNFKRTFFVNRPQSELINQSEEKEYHYQTPLTLTSDYFNKKIIYLGTNRGIFISYDEGNSWQKISIPSISRLEIRKILLDKKEPQILYIATNKGLFKINLKEKKAFQLYRGITTNNIRDVLRKDNNLFVATDKGLFSNFKINENKWAEVEYQGLFKYEPTIDEVRKAALEYNEISPKKIKKWRKSLKYRALFPTISLNYDKTIYGSASSNRIIVGPNDWSVSLSWNLGNLIWNNYEDDIDTRSRLNTQLRTDILDEVNRLYFERKRIKLEILRNPNMDEKKKIEKLLRLEELTAGLDGYTGGYFSKRLRELKGEK